MYATQGDIEQRLDPAHLLELADDDGDGVVDSAVVTAAIDDAQAVIDTHLAGRYSLPLQTVPALLVRMSADLAIASLFARRRESASPVHADRAEDAMALLTSIGNGQLMLAGVNAPDVKSLANSSSLMQEKTFSRESLEAL